MIRLAANTRLRSLGDWNHCAIPAISLSFAWESRAEPTFFFNEMALVPIKQEATKSLPRCGD